ncbi:hypothetical protein Tco_1564687 [Tanacetum coccineum]
MNRTRKVRFAEPCETSKDNSVKQVKPPEKHTTNNFVLPSTGVSYSIKASRSKPRSNTENDRIPQTSSSNKKKNKLEDHLRIAKSSLNNPNRISKSFCNVNVQQSVLNANSQLMCATCNEYYYAEDQYVVSIKKIRRIRSRTHQRPQEIKDQYAVSRGLNTLYSRYGINIIFWKISNVVPTQRNPQYAVSNPLDTPY